MTIDIDADGFDENIIVTQTQSLLVHPDRGLTVSELTFLHPGGEPVPLGHVLSRQLEGYHKSVPGMGSSGEVRTIHDDISSKEEGLAEKISIDRWRRMCFSDIVMPFSMDLNNWRQSNLEITHFQKPAFSSSTSISDSIVSFSGEFMEEKLRVRKRMTAEMKMPVIRTSSEYFVGPLDRAGMEICLNLMTGQSPDRYYMVGSGGTHLMSFEGEFRGKRIEVSDCWRKVKMVIEMNCESDIWVSPLDSVNMSESGFESVHQGAAFYVSGNADDTGYFKLEISMSMEAL
ncbi:MAG: DUF1926 domain-containing protein [Candidatus Aegiribacteria sp.]|nr:DUF1926 domain-containing protein [Candidatus Aegiribacteria sp.]